MVLNNFTYGFFDSREGDRVYSSEDFSDIFNGIIRDGVFQSEGQAMVISANTTDQSKVNFGTGKAWFNGIWIVNGSVNEIQMNAPHISLDRIDAICLKIDKNISSRNVDIEIVSGTAASSPVNPNVSSLCTENLFYYPLAYVKMRYGTSTIVTASDITNAVGTTETPFVTGILDKLDATALYAKWEDQFTTWFNANQEVLNQTPIGDFQNRLTAVETRPTIYNGTDDPATSLGVDGDIYIKYEN